MNEQTNIDQRTRDLLNGSIDGELNSAQQQELDQLLASSEEVRTLYEEFQSIARLLNEIPELEPPAYLHDAITSQVRLPVAGAAQAGKTGLFSNWLAAPWMRAGLGVAAALVLTIGIYQSDSQKLSPEDTSSMTGTVVKNPNGALPYGAILDSTRFNAEQMSGKVVLHQKKGFLLLDVRVESAGPAVVTVDFPQQDFVYAGINGLENQPDDVALIDGSISVSSSGQQHYELLLRSTSQQQANKKEGNKPTPLTLEFFADNVLVHEAELDGSEPCDDF